MINAREIVFETDLIIIVLVFIPSVSLGLTISFFSRCVSVRPPTAIPDRDCFCPLQAENWPASGADAKHGRRCISPFSAFRGSARSIIIITGSPIKLRGSSSAGEPPRCVHTHMRERRSVCTFTGAPVSRHEVERAGNWFCSTTINAQGLSRCPTIVRAPRQAAA